MENETLGGAPPPRDLTLGEVLQPAARCVGEGEPCQATLACRRGDESVPWGDPRPPWKADFASIRIHFNLPSLFFMLFFIFFLTGSNICLAFSV